VFGTAVDSSVHVHQFDTASRLLAWRGRHTSLPTSHSGRVLATALSHDSKPVVSGDLDCQVRIAQTEAFASMDHHWMHREPVLGAAWDSRAGFFVAASQDLAVTMWSMWALGCLSPLLVHSLLVSSLAFSRDEHSIVPCWSDLTVRVWDVGTDRQSARFGCGRSAPVALDVHPDNRLLACGCTNGTVALWDVASSAHQWTSKEFDSCVTDVKLSADGALPLSSSIYGCIWACNLEADECAVVMKCGAEGPTSGSITVTDINLARTTGRSLRGSVVIQSGVGGSAPVFDQLANGERRLVRSSNLAGDEVLRSTF